MALSRFSLLSRVGGWVGEINKIKDQLSPAEAKIGAELGNNETVSKLEVPKKKEKTLKN